MSTVKYQNDRTRRDNRAPRCLRHHVWMAFCGECREAHAHLLRGGEAEAQRRGEDAA